MLESVDTNNWVASPRNFLQCLEKPYQDELQRMSCRRVLQKGDHIFSRGAPGENVYILIEGRAKIYEISPLGKEVILWFCLPGEIFGIAEIPSGNRRPVTAVACTEVQLMVIPRTRFLAYMEERPLIARLIIELLSCRMRMLGDWMLNMATDDVGARIAKLFLRLSSQYGVDCVVHCGCASMIEFKLTHQEIADLVGTSRQTVSTMVNRLRRDDIISLDHKIMHLRNIDALESIAGGLNANEHSGH